MTWFTGLSTVGKAATTVTVLAVGGVAAVAVAPRAEPTAVVVGVVDGDTIDVRYGGEEQRVRLLNIDTPETVDPDKDVECLGPEASQYLAETLPAGTQVRLAFDEERHDRYGRLLAGVFLDDVLVNAEIARRGLGAAVLYEPNDRFYEQVSAASAEASEAAVGLYDPAVECTLPAQLASYEDAAAAVLESRPTTVEEADSLLAEIAALAAAAALVRDVVEAPDAFPAAAYSADALARLTSSLDRADSRREAHRQEVTAARDAEVKRIEDERRAAEEAARAAAEAEAARVAAEAEAARQAAAERAAAEAARKAAARPKPAPQTSTSGGGSSSGDGGYTGCRRYAPGGKTWTPIPCP